MSIITLLKEARSAGLKVELRGNRLMTFGPKSLAWLSKSIMARKCEVAAYLKGLTGTAQPPAPSPSPALELPWRETVAGWPLNWREYWGRLANDLEAGGMPWQEAEARAFGMIEAEMRSGAWRPPVAAPQPAEVYTKPWQCFNLACRQEGRWWLSQWGVVNCLGCRPPAESAIVVARGTSEDTPEVEIGRSNQAPPEEVQRLIRLAEARGGGL